MLNILNDTAGNSLLKTLEEPIGEVFFILITSNKDMILPIYYRVV